MSWVKLIGFKVWTWSLSGWIYWQLLSMQCKQLQPYYLCPENPPMHPTQFMLQSAEVRQKQLRGGLIKLHIFLLAPCCCRLSVQMEEDNGVLEFHASAGDLLKVETDEVSTRNRQHRSTAL